VSREVLLAINIITSVNCALQISRSTHDSLPCRKIRVPIDMAKKEARRTLND